MQFSLFRVQLLPSHCRNNIFEHKDQVPWQTMTDKNTSLSKTFILKHGQRGLQIILRLTFKMLEKQNLKKTPFIKKSKALFYNSEFKFIKKLFFKHPFSLNSMLCSLTGSAKIRQTDSGNANLIRYISFAFHFVLFLILSWKERQKYKAFHKQQTYFLTPF